ncbi:MAG: glycosyltransferase family 2 protein [Pseudotabrizicola sp.]|uniref:glycosyltransferase n=1 Tax=Pseudotabrizicola sp. TaxID=2939647 RepID=UPI0027184C9C|nr:glycosyltransferase family 2 protein [Pseudotabrizicola sp.]MDO9639905.1 glycosyltransferase family 2 protein [Pseudotabrizicola sp.]
MTWTLRPTRTVITALGPSGPLDAAVVIPARNEQRRITACLDALAVAVHGVRPLRIGVVVVVNNSNDGTCDKVLAWAMAHPAIAVQVMDCDLRGCDAHAGAARRLGLDLAIRRLDRRGILLTTDADSRVRPDWITANLRELAHADLICGAFAADQVEAKSLPAAVAMHCHTETAYMSVAVRLAALLDPMPHDPDPPHLNASGASLAFTRQLYETVGGMPAIGMSEDRAFAALAERHDFRLRHCTSVMVDTSCRMTGRTSGGMAGALRERAVEADPQVDQWLEPAATFVKRYQMRGRLRAVWPEPIALRARLATALGLAEAAGLMADPLPSTFGAFLERIETRAKALARVRLRISDCRAELPKLEEQYRAFSQPSRAEADQRQQRRRAQ